jgi:hypothetical protein
VATPDFNIEPDIASDLWNNHFGWHNFPSAKYVYLVSTQPKRFMSLT